MFLSKFKKIILKIFKNLGFFGSEGSLLGVTTFFAQLRPIETRSSAILWLHFKPIYSLEAAGAQNLQSKNHMKHEKQRHLMAKIMLQIFFVEAQDPSHILTTVFGRRYYRIKSHFFGISTPRYHGNFLKLPKTRFSTLTLTEIFE